tara:strand:- start:5122 stop:5574 length:453 start_codon:yes stop_codon:yes gene_type:complete
MLKNLVILSLLSAPVLADEYEQKFEPTVCNEGDSCVITTTVANNKSVFKLIQIEDEDGQNVGAKLSSSSAITDIFYEGVQACYTGIISDICDIGELMTGNTNVDYSQGGHTLIESFHCYSIDGVINFEYEVKSDYADEIEIEKTKLSKCE